MKHIAGIATVVALTALGFAAVAATQREEATPVRDVTLPEGYRDWKLISVAQENGSNNDIRAILGNEIAVKAFREGTRPFPDGATLVRLAWRYQSSPRNDSVFPAPQSFVAGTPTNVQVSVKDSKRYSATNGWGYGQFVDGVAMREPAFINGCFVCHAKLKQIDSRADLVFTNYSP